MANERQRYTMKTIRVVFTDGTSTTIQGWGRRSDFLAHYRPGTELKTVGAQGLEKSQVVQSRRMVD